MTEAGAYFPFSHRPVSFRDQSFALRSLSDDSGHATETTTQGLGGTWTHFDRRAALPEFGLLC
jgi:hypothetical protein